MGGTQNFVHKLLDIIIYIIKLRRFDTGWHVLTDQSLVYFVLNGEVKSRRPFSENFGKRLDQNHEFRVLARDKRRIAVA